MARRQSKVVVLAAVAALVAAAFSVVAVQAPAGALPDICGSGAGNVHKLNPGVEGDWDDNANWSNGFPNGPDEIACIDPSGSVLIDDSGTSGITLRALYVDEGGAVSVDPNASLFVNGPDTSVVDGTVHVHGASFGGTGTVVANGLFDFSGDAVLTSVPAASGSAWGGAHGTLDVPGSLEVGNGGLSIRTKYAVGISGSAFVLGSGFVTADWGTTTTIAAGGVFQLDGDGGYYQGGSVAGQTVGTIVNGGIFESSNGTTTTVVDAAYTQTATGASRWVAAGPSCSPGPSLSPARSSRTAAWAPAPAAPASRRRAPAARTPPSTRAASLLEVNAGQTGAANVQVQELALPPATTDSRAIGNDVFAHADGLSTDPTQLATITLRFSQPDVMSTPLADVQVAHISDAGVMTKAPDCAGAGLPPGAAYCVVRPVTRDRAEHLRDRRTIQTSRWRLRRTGPTRTSTRPTRPHRRRSRSRSRRRTTARRSRWLEPARRRRWCGHDRLPRLPRRPPPQHGPGHLVGLVVTGSGPGTHAFAVSAVNALGESAGAAVDVAMPSSPSPAR